MKRRNLLKLFSFLIVVSLLLAACTPPAPTSAPAVPAAATQPPAAATLPAAATEPPAQPTAAPTEAPTEAAPAGPRTGGVITYANTDGYNVLDPISSSSQTLPHYNMYDQLVTLNLDLTEYSGILAEKWESAADNMSVTITLKEGMTFHDGTPVNAEAIKWNLDQYKDPDVASPFGGWMTEFVGEIEAVDERTVLIHMIKPYAPLYYQFGQMGMVSPTAYQKLGKEAFSMAPVGSGPFIPTEIIPDVSETFKRNPDYTWWPDFIENDGPMYPDEVKVVFAKDENVMYAQLETGEVDIARIPASMLEKARANPNIEMVKAINAGVAYIGFNTEFKPFDNANIRRAIGRALDRDEIIQVGFEGEAIPAYGVLSPSIWGYSQTVEDEARAANGYDPEAAKEMLATEGYADADGDGILEKDGQKLEFKLAFRPAHEQQRIAETIQAQLMEIGVSLVLEPLESNTIIEATKQGSHQMILWSYGLSDASILTYLFKSARIGASNRTRFNDPKMDELLEAADGEMNPDLRKQRVEEAMRYLLDKSPMIPMYAEYYYTGYRKDQIAGIKIDSVGTVLLGDAYVIGE